jgi:hypothetical protein
MSAWFFSTISASRVRGEAIMSRYLRRVQIAVLAWKQAAAGKNYKETRLCASSVVANTRACKEGTMKARVLLMSLGALAFASFASAQDGRVFEMRTYTTHPGKLDALNARFRNHTLALFKKHGMENVWYGVPTDGQPGAGEKLVYILAHKSRAAADASWKAFRSDPEWTKVRTESEKDGPIIVKLESVFLAATDYSPFK